MKYTIENSASAIEPMVKCIRENIDSVMRIKLEEYTCSSWRIERDKNKEINGINIKN